MKLKHLHLHARIRAICTFCICMTLLLLFPQKAAAWSELLVKGAVGSDSWSTIATLTKQDANGNSYSGTIDASSWTSGAQLSFKLNDSKDDGGKWWGNSGTADMTSNSTATLSNVNTSGDNMTLKHSTSYSSYNINCTYSNDSWTIKITGVKSSTGGGGSSTTTCAPGLYIYGEKYGKTGDQYIYKLQRNKDKQYYISLNAINGAEWSNVQSYSTQQGIDNYYVRTIGQTYHLVYIDDQGKETDYYPSTNGYTLIGSDTNTGSKKTNAFSTTPTNNWEIGVLNSNDANGGIYNFYVNTDVNGVPQNWYYEADQTKVVAYEVNESTHTTDAYLYCTRANTTSTSAYKQNFFGMVSFVKDGYHSFLFADKTYGRRKGSNNTYDQDAAADSPNAFQFSKDHLDTGIYTTEFNPTRDYIISGDKKPTRIFIIGSALNSNLSDTFTEWDPSNATEMVYDVDEGCYKATVTLNNGKQFRFLLDHNQSGVATSLDNNFGEDSNKPGAGGDTDYNNKVQVESKSSAGENIVFNPETDTYIVRFYVERKADKTGFEWTNDYGIYRYTIEKPERLNATITPTTATVAYAASLTPKVSVVGTNAETRKYAFTIDGSNPTIDATTGEGTGSTVVRTYTYDPVVPTNDVYTFYMSSSDQLTYLDFDGNEHTLDGNTVTVKAQAVQTITEGSKYRLEGDIATGNYTFETAGVQPGTNYSLTVTNNETVSVNKATATVAVTNTTTSQDDGVDVYYTTDGTDPLKSTTARLVRNRKITVYALPGTAGTEGTIKVAIPNTKTSASCKYDITYSTSEGGYQNYLATGDTKQKALGGNGHVVVYVQPYTTNESYTTSTRQTYIYAYEKFADGSYASLTHAHRLLTDADKTTVNGKTWYFVDLEPADDYKEVNVQLGYKDGSTYKTTDATVANACQDMFLKFDVATGQITDVTHAYTGDHFYTTGPNGTKSEAANPASNSPFFYAQVPLTWTSNDNSVKVLKDDKVYSEAKVEVQPAAETSDLSSVCKITVPTKLENNTELTIKPYKGETSSNISFKIKYQNGGYYYYESANHYSTTAPLVFSADDDNDKDLRSYGRHDINHVTTGDKTHYLGSDWTYSAEPESKTTTVKDNWNGSTATVNVVPAGTTISQTVSDLTAGTPYTVQMIVRGKSGATGKLSLNDATEETATDNKTFTGYDAAGCITTDGRVEALLSGTTNGWQKLEATANTSDDGTLTISLAAADEELELSDVTLLENANTEGHVWTKAPTDNQTTEYDLSERSKANAFSFFDRGDNYNAVVYVSDKTAVGMSANTYNIAVPITTTGSGAKAYSPRRASEEAEPGDSETAYTGHKLALYDNTGSWTNDHTWGATANVQWDSFSYDRNFYGTNRGNGTRNTICLPFAMTSDQITSIFGAGAKIYEISSIDENNLVANGTQVTDGTLANTPYILEITGDDKNGVSVTESVTTKATPRDNDGNDELSAVIADDTNTYPNQLVGVYKYTTFNKSGDDNYTYYGYDAEQNGLFNIFSDEGSDFKPFRAYLKIRKTSGKAKSFYYFRVNGGFTGIAHVNSDATLSNLAPVYNLQGQMVRKAGENTPLRKGIYVQQGRKFIIR